MVGNLATRQMKVVVRGVVKVRTRALRMLGLVNVCVCGFSGTCVPVLVWCVGRVCEGGIFCRRRFREKRCVVRHGSCVR